MKMCKTLVWMLFGGAMFVSAGGRVIGAEEPLPRGGPINIDTGRQLFVDDLLIARTNLRRTFHQAELAQDKPILFPETALEKNQERGKEALPIAAPFGDGVWFDSKENLFKMWYHAGWFDGVGYATSKDGIHWERPQLDVTAGTNRVLPVREENGRRLLRDGASVWLDEEAKDVSERWKMFIYSRREGAPESSNHGELMTSADGVHWNARKPVEFMHGDNTSIYHDPFHNLWVLSVRDRAVALRDPKKTVRARFYHASTDFLKLAERKDKSRAPLWLKPDARDLPDPEIGEEPELYHFTATPYESLMIGVFGILYGPSKEIQSKDHQPKIIDLQFGYSRDGLIYDRPTRDAFLKSARTPGVWNRAYLHIATGVCLVVGDRLHFYFSAWSGNTGDRDHTYGGGTTGLATMRRDGFASMDATDGPGVLTTSQVVFSGQFPFVNVSTKSGELRAEILDLDGKPIEPFTKEKSIAVSGNSTHQRLQWQGGSDLKALAGKPVRFRFHLTGGELYAFWVSSEEGGASNGYVAAGGPGFKGLRDTPQK